MQTSVEFWRSNASPGEDTKLPYIYSIVIFYICMPLFELTLLSFCKPQSKFGLPTLRQGRRERKKATNKKYDSRGFELISSAYRADALPTELRCQLAEPES